jgi:hypothetical protein
MNYINNLVIIFGLSLSLSFSTVYADENNYGDSEQCRNGLWNGKFSYVESQIQLVKAIGKPRTYFLTDSLAVEGCPEKGEKCHSRAYVIPGDELLILKTMPGYICAVFPKKTDGAAGWVAEDQVSLISEKAITKPLLEVWSGRWSYWDNEINLNIEGNDLKGSGNAYWPGKETKPYNIGEFTGTTKPNANHATFSTDYDYGGSEGPCTVNMTLVGDYLVVSDNSGCGGNNVRFDGIYKRAN